MRNIPSSELSMSTAFNEFELSAVAYPNGRIAVLLAQYPHLTETERDELVHFTKSASRDEMRNLRSIPGLRSKLDRLIPDHSDQSRPVAMPSLWIAAMVIAIIGTLLFL